MKTKVLFILSISLLLGFNIWNLLIIKNQTLENTIYINKFEKSEHQYYKTEQILSKHWELENSPILNTIVLDEKGERICL